MPHHFRTSYLHLENCETGRCEHQHSAPVQWGGDGWMDTCILACLCVCVCVFVYVCVRACVCACLISVLVCLVQCWLELMQTAHICVCTLPP